MELVIGGAYQGKRRYVKKKYGFKDSDFFDLIHGLPEKEFKCFHGLEGITLMIAGSGIKEAELVKMLLELLPDGVIISNEIGCGVVPMTAKERLWREYHGEVLQLLARKADHVTRLFCGIPEVIK